MEIQPVQFDGGRAKAGALQQKRTGQAKERLDNPTLRRRNVTGKRETKAHAYNRQGFRSVGLDTKSTIDKPMSDWRTMDPATKAKHEENFQAKYGVTMRKATRTVGRNIDRGFNESRKAAKASGFRAEGANTGERYRNRAYEAEGQRFYHGTDASVAKPEKPSTTFSHDRAMGTDPSANRGELQDLGKKHGVSFETAVAVRAAGSPRVRLPGERANAVAVGAHVEAGKKVDTSTPTEHRPGENIEGVSLQGNGQKAAKIMAEGKKGVHPRDVSFPKMGRGKNEGMPMRDDKTNEIQFGKALSGPKVERYYEGYVHPNDNKAGTPMDVHAMSQARKGIAVASPGPQHVPNPKYKGPDAPPPKRGKPQPKTVANPAWKPNSEDFAKEKGAAEFMNEAHRRASEARGIKKTEGQTVSWHHQRRHVRGITDRAE